MEARMSRWPILFVAAAVLTCAPGCETRRDTPPAVAQAYRELVGSLDPASPGASVARLQEFARRNAAYAIASAAEAEVKARRGRLDEAYRQARDLVREDQFDRAEAVLKDLAQAPDEPAGRMAREFLAFEFFNQKATRLLQTGDVAGAEAVARKLRTEPITEAQLSATERLLDTASAVDKGIEMTRVTALQSVARMIQVYLHSSYAEDGQFPEKLTIDSPGLASLRAAGGFANSLGSIEGYTATRDGFSLVVVGKDPRQRIRVTERGIEEVR
jgi:hypothetical protein